MSNKLFSNLRIRLTLQYSLIFGVIILAIVFASYAFTWWSILAIEKQELHAKVIHEAEEWVSSKEAPVNENELASEEMLAYFVEPDGKTIILNQMGNGYIGQILMDKQKDWPTLQEHPTRMLRMHSKDRAKHYRYLAAICEVKDKGTTIGYLYMFENMETYYSAGLRTLKKLVLLFILLFGLACFGSFWLAGRNLQPISQAYDRQKQFTADASHEMRTPLAVMKLGVQGIEADEGNKLSSFSAETLSMLEQEVDRLTKLTENLMTLARSDNNSLSPDFKIIDLSDICMRVYSQLQIIATEKNIILNHQISPNINIYGDNENITRLLIILLDNAIKYSEPYTEINFSLTANKNTTLIQIADHGIGITDEDKLKIFERFYRVDKARSRSMGGLGLGLSLAKAIVEQHRGKIWIEDNKPQGSIFTVQLPNKH